MGPTGEQGLNCRTGLWGPLARSPKWPEHHEHGPRSATEVHVSGSGLIVSVQYFGHLMQRADSFEKTLMLGKIEGRRRRG